MWHWPQIQQSNLFIRQWWLWCTIRLNFVAKGSAEDDKNYRNHVYFDLKRQQETENREIQRQTDTQTKRRCRSEVYLDRFSNAGFWVCRKLVLLFLLIHWDPTVTNFCLCLSAIRIVQARSFTQQWYRHWLTLGWTESHNHGFQMINYVNWWQYFTERFSQFTVCSLKIMYQHWLPPLQGRK